MAIVKFCKSPAGKVFADSCSRYFDKFFLIGEEEGENVYRAFGRNAPETDEQIYFVWLTCNGVYIVQQWITEVEHLKILGRN